MHSDESVYHDDWSPGEDLTLVCLRVRAELTDNQGLIFGGREQKYRTNKPTKQKKTFLAFIIQSKLGSLRRSSGERPGEGAGEPNGRRSESGDV